MSQLNLVVSTKMWFGPTINGKCKSAITIYHIMRLLELDPEWGHVKSKIKAGEQALSNFEFHGGYGSGVTVTRMTISLFAWISNVYQHRSNSIQQTSEKVQS